MVRRGRFMQHFGQVGLVADRVRPPEHRVFGFLRPAPTNPGRSASAARDRGRKSGSSLIVSRPIPRGSFDVFVQRAGNPRPRQRIGERRRVGATAEREKLHEQPPVRSLRLAISLPPFSLRSGGSGPRRAVGSSCQRLYSRGQHALPRPHRDARRRRRPGAPSRRDVPRHGRGRGRDRLEPAFATWLRRMMPAGTYRAWRRGIRTTTEDRRTSRPAAAQRSCPGRPVRSTRATRSRSSTTSTRNPAHRRRGLGAAADGSDSRLVPGTTASRRSRSTRAATGSRSTSSWGTSKAQPDDVLLARGRGRPVARMSRLQRVLLKV